MFVSIRLVAAAALALCAMALVADHAFMARIHERPGCAVVTRAPTASLESCHAGWFQRAPDLSARGCTPLETAGRPNWWSCPPA